MFHYQKQYAYKGRKIIILNSDHSFFVCCISMWAFKILSKINVFSISSNTNGLTWVKMNSLMSAMHARVMLLYTDKTTKPNHVSSSALRTREPFASNCKEEIKSDLQMSSHIVPWVLHAPEPLAYAEQHRWMCGGMGAVSAQIKLWVGGPIAIQHAGTQGMSDILRWDTLSVCVVRIFFF